MEADKNIRAPTFFFFLLGLANIFSFIDGRTELYFIAIWIGNELLV
jgi:hypothetical protein